ncbi:MAG TPA: T9SS type A sorting domain-containing protein [Flavipsychrobacter sp.]|nr:T9SS type A sorting domain-containing protein [Flavipsychrobacter sp.]
MIKKITQTLKVRRLIKKGVLFAGSSLLLTTASYAQPASSYSFSSASGTYTEVSAAGTVLTAMNADTYISPFLNIGFTFTYEGVPYTQFKMSSNGFISLGAGTSALTTNNLSTANAASRPIIAPLWDDLDGNATGGSVAAYEVTGTSPNQVLTVEWRNWEWNYGSSAPVLSFQVKLYEATGNIEFVYRQESGSVNAGSASIGIGSATGSGSGSYLNLTSITTPAVSSTTSNTTLSAKPSTGQVYTFSPPAVCTGTPVAGTAAPASQMVCTGVSPTVLTVTGASSSSGLTYQWEESDDNGVLDPWTPVSGGTGANTLSFTPAAFLGAPVYYRMVITCPTSVAVPNFAATPSVLATPMVSPTTQASAVTVAPTANPNSITVNWTNGNGGRRYVAINTANSFTTPVNGSGPALVANAVYAGSGEQIVYDGTGNSLTIGGLSCNTQYYIAVYEYNRCNSAAPFDYFYSTATATGNPVSTTTTVPVLAGLPITNNFNSFTGADLHTVTPGWYEAFGNVVPTTAASAWISTTLGGSTTAKVNLYNTAHLDWIISPRFNVTVPTQVTFDAAITDYASTAAAPVGMQGTDDSVQVLVSTDGCGLVWTPIYVFSAANTTTLTNVLTNYSLNLTPYLNQTIQIAFKGTDGPIDNSPDYDFHIDNINIHVIPACPIPTALTSSNIGTNTADLSWTENGTATLWQVEYAQGTTFALGTGARVMATANNPYSLSGIAAGQQYTYFVRAVCGPNDTSGWSSRSPAFTTIPTCPVPTGLTATNITGSGADIDWVENGTATTWQVDYSLGNAFAAGSGTKINTTSHPLSLPVLNGGSQYSFFVRSICGPNDTSAWSARYSFNTTVTNDLPATAIPVTVNSGCAGTMFTNAGATFATGEPPISCRGTSITTGAQVWFKFVAPQNGFVRVSTDVTGALDTKLGLFTTSNPTDATDLAAFSIIVCDDDNGITTGTASTVFASGLTPGVTYYVAVDQYNGASTGNFCVAVDSVTPFMISPSGSCLTSTETPFSREDYTGWVSMVDAQGKLIANVRRTVAGGSNTVYSFVPSLNVNSGTVRQAGTQYYLDRNYAFTYGGPATAMTFDLRLFFLNSELNALAAVDPAATLGNLNVTHQSGSACAANYNPATGTNSALLQSGNGTASGISWINVNTPGFSNFYLMSGAAPLTIQLGTISAKNTGTNTNVVEWNTLNEEPGDVFVLERSKDGKNFDAIHTEKARGAASRYTYVDNSPFSGANYYRLLMKDLSGNASYSKVVAAVNGKNGFVVEAFPNPASQDVTVRVVGARSDRATVQLTDLTGKVVKTIKMTRDQETISLENLVNGLYLLKYTDGEKFQIQKFTKQ